MMAKGRVRYHRHQYDGPRIRLSILFIDLLWLKTCLSYLSARPTFGPTNTHRRPTKDSPTPTSTAAVARFASSATSTSTTLHMAAAKRNKRQQSKQDADDLNRWYESVDASATPDDVFWEEMERQRLQNRLLSSTSESSTSSPNGNANGDFSFGLNVPLHNGPSSTASLSSSAAFVAMMGSSSPQPPSQGSSSRGSSSSQQQQIPNPKLTAESTLSEYAAFAVSDNWLDEELAWMMSNDDDNDGDTSNTPWRNTNNLDQQLDDWEEDDSDDDDHDDDSSNAWMSSDEPWDHWGEAAQERESNPPSPRITTEAANEFLFDDNDDATSDYDSSDESTQQQEEQEFLQRLSQITISSPRLERARNSVKATEFFAQDPDVVEGFDRCWVSAVDNACFKNLKGNLRNYGIQFLDNFGDWHDGRIEDGFFTIEEIASFKARQVFNVTGLPCIASRTSWEIEPIPNFNTGSGGNARPYGSPAATPSVSPRVASGYRFNDVGMHVDYICDALRPLSEPSRVTQFKTCLCYYDGEIEVYDYGIAEVDLIFSNSIRTFIPVSQAINELVKTLELTFGLEYQPWIKKRVDANENAIGFGSASVRLRDRVLKEGRVLPNEIIDVSAFMDSMVDVDLMDECAKELSNRFMEYKPNKVITVATTGLVIALPIAKYLQVPLVYARKERNVVMADTFKASYSSKTVGKNRELLVSKSHLDEDDRVLVVDDFLSSGSSQEALLRIVAESGATAVGVGVLLEKVYESGRQSLSGFNVPIHSLCRVASLQNGVIQLVEEEGYDRMNKKKNKVAATSTL